MNSGRLEAVSFGGNFTVEALDQRPDRKLEDSTEIITDLFLKPMDKSI